MRAEFFVRPVTFVALALAAAALAEASTDEVRAGGGCREVPITEVQGAAQASPNTVAMLDTCFEPSILRVETGAEVTWTNVSKVERHNVAGQNASWGSYDELRDGQSLSHKFDKAGTYAYSCFVHNGMIGVVVVGDGKGTLTSSVSASARDAQGVLASVPESEPQSPAAAPASIADDDGNGGLSEWTLAGMLLVGLVAGGAVVAVARRR